jgi:hypothetical protein
MILISLWKILSLGEKVRTLTRTKEFHISLSHSKSKNYCSFVSHGKCRYGYRYEQSYSRH